MHLSEFAPKWKPVETEPAPKNTKILLLSCYGVAVIGHWYEEGRFSHWCGLPKLREPDTVLTDVEQDPDGRQPDEPGAKLDAGKPRMGLLSDFRHALVVVGQVATFGAEKYSPGGWLSVPDGERRYQDALWRHLLADGETDEQSGLLHAAHAAWNALAVLELELRRKE